MHADTLIADHRGSEHSSPINVTMGATLSLVATTITGTDAVQPAGPSGYGKKATGAAISAYPGAKVRLQMLSLGAGAHLGCSAISRLRQQCTGRPNRTYVPPTTC